MPLIIIEDLGQKEIHTKESNRKVIELIHENYIDWMHACGKKGRCTSCKMIVLSGMENLSERTPAEQLFIEIGGLKGNQRLSCQSVLLKGTIRIKQGEKYGK